MPLASTNNNDNNRQNSTRNNRQNTTTSTGNQSPRVQIHRRTDQRQPRVVPVAPQTTCQPANERMAPINEKIRIYLIGTTVRKKFNWFNHIGKIIKYDKEYEWYTIEYQDGDWEEMSNDEVTKY